MTAEADPLEDGPKKGSKLPLILGIVLALVGGGGGFFAVNSLVLGGDADSVDTKEEAAPIEPLETLSFVPLDPFVVTLNQSSGNALLRFTAQLEVSPEHASEVENIKPRIVDVLNGYLRAVDIEDLSDPTVLVRLRGQMLRRVQVVAGTGRVRDLLIMEFVVN